MSFKSPKSFAAVFVLALAVAVLSASCGGSQPQSPTSPSLVPAASIGGGTARVGTSSTDTVEGQDEGDEAEPQPAPAPAPAPEPAPETPAPAPSPAPNPAPAPGPATPAPNPATD